MMASHISNIQNNLKTAWIRKCFCHKSVVSERGGPENIADIENDEGREMQGQIRSSIGRHLLAGFVYCKLLIDWLQPLPLHTDKQTSNKEE